MCRPFCHEFSFLSFPWNPLYALGVKKMVVKFIWVLLLVCLVSGEEDLWKKFAHECSGRSQSPIDIQVSKVKYDSSLSLSLKGFNQEIDGSFFNLINNGHTVQLNLIDSFMRQEDIPIVKGPALNDKVYKFVQLHFHWHYNDSEGSEHAIDGKRYALEVSYMFLLSCHVSLALFRRSFIIFFILPSSFFLTNPFLPMFIEETSDAWLAEHSHDFQSFVVDEKIFSFRNIIVK